MSSQIRPYYIVVIELDDVVPRRDPGKPNLLVTKSLSSANDRFEMLQRSPRDSWYRGHLLKIRHDLAPSRSFDTPETSDIELKKVIRHLTSEGYTVNRDTRVWQVYVVELDSSAIKEPGEGFVYVGQTSKDPQDRLNIHLSQARNSRGPLYSRVVSRHGIRLLPELAPERIFFDAESAKGAEAEHAEFLRSIGYNVRGGH